MAIDETGKVTFTPEEQTEVDRVVQERLAREKGKYADYEDVKGIVEELQSFGYKGTPSEIREVIRTQREEVAKQQELAELQQQAKTQGTSPELLAEMRELKKELSELKGERQAQKQVEESKKKANEDWKQQVEEMSKDYPDVDLDALAGNQKFLKFAKGKKLPLKELYEDFTEFVGETETEAITKAKSKEERSTSSGKNKGSDGKTYGLSDEQKKTVDDWNRKNPRIPMSYKEFAERL